MKDKIEKLLKDAKVRFEFISLPSNQSFDTESLAVFHGVSLGETMPTIMFKTEKGFIAIQRKGDARFDSKKIRETLNIKTLRTANKEEIESLGFSPGLVPPMGYDIPFFMDKKVLDNNVVYTGSGGRLFDLKIDPKDLQKINNAVVGDFSEDAQIGFKRVFSGTRATGRLHLGNYLGAVKGYLELQNNPEYETIYMVMDLHAITTPYDKEKLAQNTKNVIMDYLACGLDPEKSIISAQSLVPEHPYLANIFSSVVTIARMQHLPTFKEKVKQHPEGSTMALLNYPVLMAADILVYKAGLVPVGIDQEPHLEVAREIAKKMNEKYGTDFPEPIRFATKGEYVPSLTGEGKMSKSVGGSFINLTDSYDEIKKKIRSIPTATTSGGEMTAGVKSLFALAKLFLSDAEYKFFESNYNVGKLAFVQLKDGLADAIFNDLKPIQEKRKYYEENPKIVDDIIAEGAEKARKIAGETLKEVKENMGFI